ARTRANAKQLTVVKAPWDRMGIRAEPVMRAIGPAFGKDAPKVKALIEGADGRTVQERLAHEDTVVLRGPGRSFTIAPAHVTFSKVIPEGFTSAPMEGGTVYVDGRLSDDLEGEGYAREVIRRLQETRRQLDLAVGEFIVADVLIGDRRIASLVRTAWAERIQEEVRARSLSIRDPGEGWPEAHGGTENVWDIEGIEVRTSVSRAAP
ncbi:MAG TPA: DUF5915 domain-containing protein, partial [Methanomicrobiales archaeon]|nr:DUF5915 domain-containing protein [Methanomicrobiales archaeon]